MARRGRPRGPKALALLTEQMTMPQAGVAALLALWRDEGHLVPFDDLDACCAIAHATTSEERATVTWVVDTLFTPHGFTRGNLRDAGRDAHTNFRDATVTHEIPISTYYERDAAPFVQAERIMAAERQAATRARKYSLRRALTEVGIPTDSRQSIGVLENLCWRAGIDIDNACERYSKLAKDSIPVTQSLARVCVSDRKGINTEFKNSKKHTLYSGGVSYNLASARDPLAADAAAVMRAEGLAEASEAHPELSAVLALGATVPELRLAAIEASARGKGFAYALGIARNRRLALSEPAQAPSPSPAVLLAPEPHDGVPLPGELLARIQALKTPRRPSVETSQQPHEDQWSLDESRT